MLNNIADKSSRMNEVLLTFKLLEEFFEFINGKSGVPDYTTHCVGIDGIITRDRKESCVVRHYYMLFPVPNYAEARFFQSFNSAKVIDSWDL